jgi:hypothetical protein
MSHSGRHARLPPGVFHPGETSRLLHARLLDGTLPVTELRYAAMGCDVVHVEDREGDNVQTYLFEMRRD